MNETGTHFDLMSQIFDCAKYAFVYVACVFEEIRLIVLCT